MTRDFFKPLAEYLKSSQKEWRTSAKAADTAEMERQARYEAGIQAMDRRLFEEAVEHLKKATASKVYRKEAYYHLAECYEYLNMIPLARKTYERLMRLDYNFADVQQKIRSLDTGKITIPTWQSAPTQQGTSGAAAATAAISEKDRYEIVMTVYEGKHSRIYRVQDKLLGRIIALKQIDCDYPDRPRYLQHMKERTALDHPNILRIYDIDEHQGHIAMEYIEGRDLRYALRFKKEMVPKIIMHIAIQIINGLHHAHLNRIVHHALTPEHILLNRQYHLKLIAFRALDSFVHIHDPEDLYKYLYMPPELLQNRTITVVSNIYSFGVILYEMLVGRTPFRLSQIKAFMQHQTAPLTYDESPLPVEIQPILRSCLAMAPEQRYPNIHSVGEALIQWFKTYQRDEAHDDDIAAYRDYLLMAWADGKLTEQEALFLAHKRQELHITDQEAETAELQVKQEIKDLLHDMQE